MLPVVSMGVSLIQQIPHQRCPLEMLYLLQEFQDETATFIQTGTIPEKFTSLFGCLLFTNAELDSASQKVEQKKPASGPLSGDDFLPLTILAIIRATPRNIYSAVYYMENFVFTDLSASSYG